MVVIRVISAVFRRLLWSIFLVCLGFTLGVTAGNDIVQGVMRIVVHQVAPEPTPEQNDGGFKFPWSSDVR